MVKVLGSNPPRLVGGYVLSTLFLYFKGAGWGKVFQTMPAYTLGNQGLSPLHFIYFLRESLSIIFFCYVSVHFVVIVVCMFSNAREYIITQI